MAAVNDAMRLLKIWVSSCNNFTVAPYCPRVALSWTITISQTKTAVSTDSVSNMPIIFMSLYAYDKNTVMAS